jgi:hypothetical protein
MTFLGLDDNAIVRLAQQNFLYLHDPMQ